MNTTHTIPEMRDAFEAWITKPLKNGRSLSNAMNDQQLEIARETWCDAWQAAQSQPAPPVPSSVQEIMRLMMSYASSIVKYSHTPFEHRVEAGRELDEALKPLQAALTALVDESHRLKFELDGVNIGETKKWLLRSAKAEATLRLVHRMMPIFEKGLEQLAFTAETGGEIWADMRRIQELLSGHTAESWAAMEPVTALTFFEDSALNVPPLPTHGIEPEQGGNHG